jgi:MFS family permease
VATETDRDEGVNRVYKDHSLHVLWGVTLMGVLGTSTITPAFPTIVRELGVSSGQVGLLITVFTLPCIVMTPLLGVPSDRHGRKKILVPALLLFGIPSGAFARHFSLLNAPTENRGACMATNGMSLRAGQTIGPLFMASAAGFLGLTGAYLTAASLALAR